MPKDILKSMESNIILWYNFEANSNILYLGEKENEAYQYLKEKYNKVDLFLKEQNYSDKKSNVLYDYIIVLKDTINIKEVIEVSKQLKDTGIILLAFNNQYGISKFITYDCKNRLSALEQMPKEELSKENIKKALEKEGYSYINEYYPFPNYKNVDIILTNKLENISDKLDKYFVSYDVNMSILIDEIKLLRNIANYDKNLFISLSNSYILEISKKPIKTDVKYVSFNNYRKKEYQLATIIRENIVEKKPTNKNSMSNIDRIGKNLEKLNDYDIEILDKFVDGNLYSKFINNKQTLDIELAKNYENIEYILNVFNDLKQMLLKNTIEYNNKDSKNYPNILKKQSSNLLNELHYLKYAFYDMVPKNCFYIEGKYCFFDQEWMENYLPVEFILYRSIINSYDLVRKINVDELLEKIGILKYKTIFEELDKTLRENIIDKEKFQQLNTNYSKMYEVMYENEIVKNQLIQYEENNKKQNDYIKYLEGKLKQN